MKLARRPLPTSRLCAMRPLPEKRAVLVSGYARVRIIQVRIIEEALYIEGVSLTHGPPGNRSHIWSFVATFGENSSHTLWNCPCANTKIPWPHQTPWNVGQDYFCDTSFVFDRIEYCSDNSDLLWDMGWPWMYT